MTTFDNRLLAKINNKFYCELCDYSASKKFNLNIHFESIKHKNNIETTNNNELTTNNNSKLAKISTPKKYVCEKCDKIFNDRAGLWRHNKKCEIVKQINKDVCPEISQELILSILKQNTIFQQTIIEQNKTIIELSKNCQINNNSNNTNSNNKAFNLNFFLNETCKDAMNIMDFVDSIKLQLTDLESVGKLGYVEGISNIIVKNLKELDVTKRPVNCTDKKRETLYVKDENKWEKDETKQKMHKLVKRVASKNARLLPKFKEAHPDCSKSVSKFSDQYNKIIVESMGGSGDNDFEKEEKIINKISKEIMVEK